MKGVGDLILNSIGFTATKPSESNFAILESFSQCLAFEKQN